jgi:hypothetical protein
MVMITKEPMARRRAGGIIKTAVRVSSFGIVFLVFLFTAAGIVRSQEDAARAIFERVSDLGSQGRYEEAISLLHRIIADHPDSEETLRRAFNTLVFVHLSQGNQEDAATAARRGLDRFPDLVPDPVYVPVEPVGAILDEMRTEMFGLLLLTTVPDSCRVILDGESMGESPVRLEHVRAGKHVLHLYKAGYQEITRHIEIEAGEKREIEYNLKSLAEADRRGFQSGFGAGLGAALPVGTAKEYGDLGVSFSGFGWLGVPQLSFMLFRASVEGLFYTREHGGTSPCGVTTPDSTFIDLCTMTRQSIILKIVTTAEFFWRFERLEPYAGAGLGIYIYWNIVDFTNETYARESTSSLTSGGKLGLNVLAGLRFYLTSRIALDVSAHYDRIPGLDVISGLSESGEERESITFESLSMRFSIFFGRF